MLTRRFISYLFGGPLLMLGMLMASLQAATLIFGVLCTTLHAETITLDVDDQRFPERQRVSDG